MKAINEYTKSCDQCGTAKPLLIDTHWDFDSGYAEDYKCRECGYKWSVYFRAYKVVDQYGNCLIEKEGD